MLSLTGWPPEFTTYVAGAVVPSANAVPQRTTNASDINIANFNAIPNTSPKKWAFYFAKQRFSMNIKVTFALSEPSMDKKKEDPVQNTTKPRLGPAKGLCGLLSFYSS